MGVLHEVVTVSNHAFTTRNNRIEKENSDPDALLIKALPLALQNHVSNPQIPLQLVGQMSLMEVHLGYALAICGFAEGLAVYCNY